MSEIDQDLEDFGDSMMELLQVDFEGSRLSLRRDSRGALWLRLIEAGSKSGAILSEVECGFGWCAVSDRLMGAGGKLDQMPVMLNASAHHEWEAKLRCNEEGWLILGHGFRASANNQELKR